MFPELTRDDVFRLETARLWLRWPRRADAADIERYSAQWAVARFTAHIPHPYLHGAAERFVAAAREANAAGGGLTLVLSAVRAPGEAVGAVSLSLHGNAELELGYALAPEVWGRGYATEAARAIVDAAFRLTRASEIAAGVAVANAASRRVLEKVGFGRRGRASDASGRLKMVECDAFAYSRADWARASPRVLEAAS